MFRACLAVVLLSFSLTSLADVKAGQMATHFKMPGMKTGNLTRLKNYRGKVMSLEFWAYWCGPFL